MAGTGAPQGNRRYLKGRRFADAIERALDLPSKSAQIRRLDAIAAKLCDLAEDGDISAIREIIDRVDGRAHQSIAVDISKRTVADMDDPALAGVIAESSGSGVTSAQDGSEEPASVH